MNKLILTSLVLLSAIFIFSCKKSEEPKDAIADVFSRSLKYNGFDAFSGVFSVTSYDRMSEVTVNTPDGITFKLSDLYGNGIAFFKDTSMHGSLYHYEPLFPGIYSFNVTFSDGEKKVFTNTLKDEFLLPPVIDSLYKKTNGTHIRIKWQPVQNANAYQVRVLSGNNEIIPWLEFIDLDQYFWETRISNFSLYLPGTLTFELRAVYYEDDPAYVQAISYSSVNIDL